MQRRALLATVPTSLTGITGCLDASGSGSSAESSTEEEQNTGSSTESSAKGEAPTGDAVRWIYETGGSVRHQPTIQNGVVYASGGTNNRATSPRGNFDPNISENVYALSADEGSKKWRFEAPAGVMSSPIIEEGVFVIIGWNADRYRIAQRLMRVDDGTKTWKTTSRDDHVYLLQISDGAAYLGTSNDEVGLTGETVFSIQTGSGDQRWSIGAGNTTEGFVSGDTLYIVEAHERTRALAIEDGSDRWQQAMVPPSYAPQVFGDTMYLVPNRENKNGNYPLVAVDVTNGSEKWRFSLPVDGRFLPTGAVQVGDTVYVTEYDGGLYGVNSADGSEQWRYLVNYETRNQPVIVNGTVYMTVFDRGVHAIDAASGKRQWKQSVPGYPEIVAGNTQGIVISGGENSEQRVHAYTPDGTERWSFSHAGSLTPPAVEGSKAFVGTNTGYVVALAEQ